jgi:hypothetical protein
MNTTTTGTQPLEIVEGRGSLVRARFTPGLLLLDEDLTAGVDYTRGLSRLLFRNLFGCGVICGLTVDGAEATGRCLTVTVHPGLALDCIGDPIEVRQSQSLVIKATCDQTLPDAVWVTVRRRENDCMPRALACPPESGGASAVKTRTLDCYEIAVLDQAPTNACGCLEQPPAPGPAPPPPPSDPSPAKKTKAQAKPDAAPEADLKEGAKAEDTQADKGAGSRLGEVPQCYQDDVAGKCQCECCTGGEWILLAKLTRPPPAKPSPTGSSGSAQQNMIAWDRDYSVSRFIRPVLLGEVGAKRG